MTRDEAAERLRGIVKGIDDGGAMARLGYRVPAEDLFVRASAETMRSRPGRSWNRDEIRDLARIACLNLPAALSDGQKCLLLLPGGRYLSQRHGLDGMRLVRGEYGYSNQILRPSMDVDGIVETADLTDDQKARMRGIVEDVRCRAEAHMRAVLGELVPQDGAMIASRPSTRQWFWTLTLSNGIEMHESALDGQIVHDRAGHVLPAFARRARNLLRSRSAMQIERRRIEDLIAYATSDIVRMGLPLVVRIEPSSENEGDDMEVVLDGYGPTGIARCVPVTRMGIARPLGPTAYMIPSLTRVLVEQQRLHQRFGPCPGSRDDAVWTIDAPTARMLALSGRGTRIARDVIEGMPYDGGDSGISIRVAGRHLLGTYDIAPGVTWKGDRLDVVGTEISRAIATALRGRPVRAVVDHHSLRDDDVVGRVVQRKAKTYTTLVVHARPEMIPIERIDALAA